MLKNHIKRFIRGGDLLDLDRAIRIINYDINEDERVSDQKQIEAHKKFFKELFSVDLMDERGKYKSAYQIFSEASNNKLKNNSVQISNH